MYLVGIVWVVGVGGSFVGVDVFNLNFFFIVVDKLYIGIIGDWV